MDKYSAGWYSYFYSDAPDVIRNIREIKNKEQLAIEENSKYDKRLDFLHKYVHLQGSFDYEHLCQIHKYLFQDTYVWAGQPRPFDLPDVKIQSFTPSRLLGAEAGSIAQHITRKRYLCGMDREQFADAIAGVHTRLEELRPFIKGNNRTAREFLKQLASVAGYKLDYHKNLPGREFRTAQERTAAVQAYYRNAAVPRRAIAFERNQGEKWEEACMEFPELMGAYSALEEAKVNKQGQALHAEFKKIAYELRAGHLPGNELVTPELSRSAINMAAAYRNLLVLDAPQTATSFSGEAVAVSAHHVLVDLGDDSAVCYRRDALERDVFRGEQVHIGPRGAAQGKHPVDILPRGGAYLPADTSYKKLLGQYADSKLAQAERLRARLEKQNVERTAALQDAQNRPPKFYSLPSTRKAYEEAIKKGEALKGTAQNRLNRVHEILGSGTKIKAFAENKMRRQNRGLSQRHDAAKQIERMQQLGKQPKARLAARSRAYGR